MKLANNIKRPLETEKRLKQKTSRFFEDKDDIDIWKSFKEGDGSAFNYIYHQYFPVLFSYGGRFCNDRELIKDAIQDLFVYLKVNQKKLGDTDSIKFYLFKALRRNISRKVSRKVELTYQDFLQLPQFEIMFSHETHLISMENQRIQKTLLNQAIRKLTERQKEAIAYFYYEGFSYAQIASLMNFSKTEYARKLIYRAVNTIKEYIGEHAEQLK